MKLKGVNPFEQHVEKIVLAVVGAIFLIVLAGQFLLEPNRVKVGNQQPVPPARAFHTVRDEAIKLREAMRPEAQIDLPEVAELDLADQFLARRHAPVSQSPTIVALGPPLQVERVAGPAGPIGDEIYAMLAVPAPTTPVAYSVRGTIDPFEVFAIPALAAHMPEQQPFDKAAVSIEARFDGQALRQEFLKGGPDGAKPLPAAWWRDNVEILVVRLDREELTDTGEWTNLIEGVTPIPGRFSIRDRLREVAHANDLLEVVDEAMERSAEIRRPRYLRMIAGPQWVPPTEAAARRPQVRDARVDALLRERQGIIERQEAAQRDLDALDGDGRGGPGGARAPGGGEPPRDQARRRQELERAIQGFQRRIESIDAELTRRGFTPPVVEEPDIGQPERQQRPLLENPSVRLWAHDITAEPGKIYRYRLAVGINNPAFARGQALVEAQQDLAARPVIYSTPSEWSAPVQVLDDQYFFIHTAHAADALGGARAPARARAEVYQFFYGYYRKGEVQLEPGDLIIAQVGLPASELLRIFDQPEIRNGEVPGPGVQEPGQGEQRPGRAWEQPVVASVASYLLDVAGIPGAAGPGAQTRTVAYLRGENGGIKTRYPDLDRQSEIYRYVLQSSQEGERQGAPEPEVAPEEPIAPGPGRRPRPERETPTPPTGGGGMGGG